MIKHLVSTGAALGVTFAAFSAMALTVTTTNSASTLANEILGDGVVLDSATYTGAAAASGTFTDGGNIGISTGIILTSGSAALAVGPNNSASAGANNGQPGDTQLAALVPGYSSNDAAALTMTFTTTTGDLFFNYVFASEEYNEWVGSAYNDAFAFFLDGTNIALLPGTTTPVSINNVNLNSNSADYVNNTASVGIDTQYDGLTTVLTASAIGLAAGTHTIKLVISDMGDYILDSGVFIQSGSFAGTPTSTVPELSSASGMAALTLLLGGLLAIGGRRQRQGGLLVQA